MSFSFLSVLQSKSQLFHKQMKKKMFPMQYHLYPHTSCLGLCFRKEIGRYITVVRHPREEDIWTFLLLLLSISSILYLSEPVLHSYYCQIAMLRLCPRNLPIWWFRRSAACLWQRRNHQWICLVASEGGWWSGVNLPLIIKTPSLWESVATGCLGVLEKNVCHVTIDGSCSLSV